MRLIALVELLGLAVAASNVHSAQGSLHVHAVEETSHASLATLGLASLSASDSNARLRHGMVNRMSATSANLLRRHGLGLGASLTSAGNFIGAQSTVESQAIANHVLDGQAISTRKRHADKEDFVKAPLMPDEGDKEAQVLPAEVERLEKDAEKEIADTKEEVVQDVTQKLKQAKDGPTNPAGECLGAAVCIFIIASVIFVSVADHWLQKLDSKKDQKARAEDGVDGGMSPVSPTSPGSKGWFQTMDARAFSEEFNSMLDGIALNNLPGQFGLSPEVQEKNRVAFGLNKITPPTQTQRSLALDETGLWRRLQHIALVLCHCGGCTGIVHGCR